MDRWVGKVALVTGASVGIGTEITRDLAEKGMKVIAVARRLEKLQELEASIKRDFNVKIYPIQCDVQKEEDILKVFKWAEEKLNGIDVLVNNAGVLSSVPLLDGSVEIYRQIMEVNVIALAICSREFIKSIKRRETFGHIINISSVVGHNEYSYDLPTNLYRASKHAVTGMATSLRLELRLAKIDVKVTNISPGAVITDMLTNNFSESLLKNHPLMRATDISNTVVYCLSMPHHVEIQDLIIMPKDNFSDKKC